jgi:hypothetical protein
LKWLRIVFSATFVGCSAGGAGGAGGIGGIGETSGSGGIGGISGTGATGGSGGTGGTTGTLVLFSGIVDSNLKIVPTAPHLYLPPPDNHINGQFLLGVTAVYLDSGGKVVASNLLQFKFATDSLETVGNDGGRISVYRTPGECPAKESCSTIQTINMTSRGGNGFGHTEFWCRNWGSTYGATITATAANLDTGEELAYSQLLVSCEQKECSSSVSYTRDHGNRTTDNWSCPCGKYCSVDYACFGEGITHCLDSMTVATCMHWPDYSYQRFQPTQTCTGSTTCTQTSTECTGGFGACYRCL